MADDHPALPAGWVRVAPGSRPAPAPSLAGTTSPTGSPTAARPPPPPAFEHAPSGFTTGALVYHVPGRFPPYYSFSARAWMPVAPMDDGTGRRAVVLTAPDATPPAAVARAMADGAARKAATTTPKATRLPVKMDRPVPRLPHGWAE